ncbi:MAG: TOBE domain-containing protein, partial [Frankiaceae bacterium]|nr:TOBE domain-containing protein [Frankiaceae bacterium]
VTDVSFTGLSTQYVVRTGWGQDLAVFAQNDGTDAAAHRGDEVVVAWRPEHAFPLREESPAGTSEPAPALASAAP